MIEVRRLRKEYGSTVAVNDVSFEVGKGEVLGFLGPNAAGKTTTMRMLAGFLPPTAGSATIAGFDIRDHSLEVRRRIGYLPEHVPLYDDMTVGQYLRFMAQIRDVPRAHLQERVESVMAAVRIQDRSRQAISKLSRGLRQRVGIAQAMIHDPDVLILDEPTVGLDPAQVIEIRDLIRSIGQRHTVILSTHILAEASLVCDRLLIIHGGVIVAQDTPAGLTSHLVPGQQIDLLVRGAEDQVRLALLSVPGVSDVHVPFADSNSASSYPSPTETPAGSAVRLRLQAQPGFDLREAAAAEIIRRGWGLLELSTVTLTLEEIFLHVTARARESQARLSGANGSQEGIRPS